ncbi:MAG: transcription termination factor NusA [Candidatus Dependentiae bacterium]
MRLTAVIEELVEERGLDKETLNSIICEGMLAAYEKKYPNLPLRARHDKKEDDVAIEVEKTVVSSVQDPDVEISTRKARHIDEKLSAGDKAWIPFDGKIGRIEILRAKQVIANQIRKIEALAVYNEFKEKEGTIVHGVVHKCERGGIAVKLQDSMGFLPKSLMSSTDKCIVGYPIRALLKEVLSEPRNENQLILDRASDQFLYKLFELEIPEVFEKLVEIKKIVRAPGYKSKVVVASNDKNIDPVGTCVGVGGVRIKPILKELGGEKIDVLSWDESPEAMIKNSLKPAVVNKVQIKGHKAYVWVDEDQRSLAIGKMGKNISLAARLNEIDIDLVQEDKKDEAVADIIDINIAGLEE